MILRKILKSVFTERNITIYLDNEHKENKNNKYM